MGEIGSTAVPVPGMDDVPLPARGPLGIEKGGEVPVSLGEVTFEAVTGELGVVKGDESMMVVPVVVKVCVKVSGSVIVVPMVPGVVGAVPGDTVSLHGVGNNGDEKPVAGLPSVDEEISPDGTGKYPYGGEPYPVGLTDGEEALVAGTIELDTDIGSVTVTVWIIALVLVDCDGMTGEPSVDGVESVPFLGGLL